MAVCLELTDRVWVIIGGRHEAQLVGGDILAVPNEEGLARHFLRVSESPESGAPSALTRRFPQRESDTKSRESEPFQGRPACRCISLRLRA